nr:FeoA family protein [Ahniella affigens]
MNSGQKARVVSVHSTEDGDPIARRLGDLGFVQGESVRIVAFGPFGGDPIAVQIGQARFALRRSEAARVQVEAQS